VAKWRNNGENWLKYLAAADIWRNISSVALITAASKITSALKNWLVTGDGSAANSAQTQRKRAAAKQRQQ
jgi:hypothetical protein